MLAAVLAFGEIGKGAQRWLDLGFFRFQPSEAVKMTVPMMVAWFFAGKNLPPSWGRLIIAAFLIMLPSVFLSGFMFPRSEMVLPIRAISYLLPVTYFVEIVRGVILRGADFFDLIPYILGLCVCCVVILGLSITRFQKQID